MHTMEEVVLTGRIVWMSWQVHLVAHLGDYDNFQTIHVHV